MNQASERVYAAIASSRSSVQPLFGLEYEPHSTVARGFGVRLSDAYFEPIIWSYAAFHGCAPAWTLPRTKSSWAWLTSTPGCAKVAGAAATCGARASDDADEAAEAYVAPATATATASPAAPSRTSRRDMEASPGANC
ncbi:hypothetical protein [Dactylosporangium darangshiense]